MSSGVEPARGGGQHEPADLLGVSRGNAHGDHATHGLGDQIDWCRERGLGERGEIVKATNRMVVRLVAKPSKHSVVLAQPDLQWWRP